MSNVSLCHRCEFASKVDGVRPCTLTGRDILDHARKGDCPAGKFTAPDTAIPTPQPAKQGGCGCKKEDKNMGSIASQIASGAAGLVKHLGQRAGVALDVASIEDTVNRLSICTGCEHRRENNCNQCGCIIVAKAAQKTQSCPEGKW